jgi:hypothetical protein
MPRLNLDVLTLDPELDHALGQHIDRQIQHGQFELSQGRMLIVDGGSGKPEESVLFSQIKSALEPYVDFENGGLRLLEVNMGSQKAHFTLVPGWEASPADIRGKTSFGGPTITLKFTMRW